jgi:hypothetical protein
MRTAFRTSRAHAETPARYPRTPSRGQFLAPSLPPGHWQRKMRPTRQAPQGHKNQRTLRRFQTLGEVLLGGTPRLAHAMEAPDAICDGLSLDLVPSTSFRALPGVTGGGGTWWGGGNRQVPRTTGATKPPSKAPNWQPVHFRCWCDRSCCSGSGSGLSHLSGAIA